jgi:hypothetical protein
VKTAEANIGRSGCSQIGPNGILREWPELVKEDKPNDRRHQYKRNAADYDLPASSAGDDRFCSYFHNREPGRKRECALHFDS